MGCCCVKGCVWHVSCYECVIILRECVVLWVCGVVGGA